MASSLAGITGTRSCTMTKAEEVMDSLTAIHAGDHVVLRPGSVGLDGVHLAKRVYRLVLDTDEIADLYDADGQPQGAWYTWALERI